jgi:hypothetical protein
MKPAKRLLRAPAGGASRDPARAASAFLREPAPWP